MKAKRSGELMFREGRSTVKDFFRTIATELTTEEWAVLNRTSDPNVPWTFDINRSIKIPTASKKDMVKLYRILARTSYKAISPPYGEITVLQGNPTTGTIFVVLQINEDNASIAIPGDSDEAETASIIANYISANFPAFAESTAVENKVTVKGAGSVRNISLNSDKTDTGVIAKTEMMALPTVARVTPLGSSNAGTVTFSINADSFDVELLAGEPRSSIASKIITAVNAMTGYSARIVDATTSTIEISHTTDNILSFTSNVITTKAIATKSNVESGIGYIDFRTDIFLTSTSLSINVDGTPVQAISIAPGDTIITIVTALNSRIAGVGLRAELASNSKIRIIRDNGSVTTLSASSDITVDQAIFVAAQSNISTQTVGKLTIFGEALEKDALYTITVNGTTFSVQMLQGYDKPKMLQELLSAVLNTYPQSYILNSSLVIVPTNTSITSFSTNIPAFLENAINTSSSAKEPSAYAGVIEIVQSAGEEFEITIRINFVSHSITIPADSDSLEIAALIADYFSNLPEFANSIASDNIVEIQGTTSVDQLDVGFVEINSTYYDVQGDLILGTGVGDNGTKIGDNVIIKTREIGRLFDYATFAPKEVNGVVRHIAPLLSRPKGSITVFMAATESYQKERAMKKNQGEPIYSINGTNLSRAVSGTNAIKVYKGTSAALATEISRDIYQVDFNNGLIMFPADPLGTDEMLYVDYTVITDQILSEIPKTDYQIMDDRLVALEDSLNEVDCLVFVNYKWELIYPSSVLSFAPDQDRMVLKTYIDISQVKNKSLFKEYYIEFKRPDVRADRVTGVDVRYGTAITNEVEPTLVFDQSSAWSRLAWYKASSTAKLNLNEDMAISYFMNFTQEYWNLFVQGSAAFDSDYTNYIIAPMMFGLLDKYEGAINSEETYNCYFTVGSDKIGVLNNKWGENTATGITDIMIDKTLSNVPFQAHYPSFHTVPEFMNKHYVNVSTETAAEQVGEIILYHPVEKARGKIQGILTGDRSTIEHLGVLIENREKYDISGALINSEGSLYNECGGPNVSNQKTYVQLNINAPYSLFNNSPNVFYGVCMRKE